MRDDSEPFFVCAVVTPERKTKDGFISACYKCKSPVRIPEKDMTKWRDTGAIVVCPRCSGAEIGQFLDVLPITHSKSLK